MFKKRNYIIRVDTLIIYQKENVIPTINLRLPKKKV